MADNYIKNNADRMLELLKGGPSDLIRAAEIGCDTLNSIYDDDEFKAHINRLSGRPFIDDSESVAWAGDVEAIKWTSRRWEPGLLSEFPFFLNQVRKVMLDHKIEPGLVDDICRQAEELRQTGGKWTGDVRTFFAIIRHTADEICRLREVIEENPENEAILNDARNKLLNAVYVMAGITCISSTTFALLNPDFRNFIIALANALASTYFSLAAQSSPIPRNTPNYQAKRKLQRGVYISIILALLVLLSSIIIYLRFTSIHTSHPIPTASAVGSSEPHPLSFDKDFYGYFYVNPNGSSNGTFDRTSSSPSVITESFSVIDFNPNSGKMCSNTIVNTRTKPFTDVYNSNGRCELIPVESGSDTQAFQAGVGNLQYFEAVFL
ncbi:MAG TPA: hypothetical protein VFQ36_25695, partial [Ktedonobacteraceae bacterium]|nr:hypothetical protein [Ktedonobacteraceae bacterium]